MTSDTMEIDDFFEEEDGETLTPLPGTSTRLNRRTSRTMMNPQAKYKEEVVYDYDLKNFVHEKPMREWRFTIPGMKYPIIMNPVTTIIGIVPLWATAIWCMANPQEALDSFVEMRGKIAHGFTWFVIITKPISLFFLLWITYKYGHIRFGGPEAKPEFGNFEYFAMIFTCGVGVGMYYYGVSEPLWHQTSHWFAEAGYRSQDEIDQMAMVITIYHWGFQAFTTYLTVAIATSLASYRFRLPLIFRSTFYPILGEYTWGYLGDLLDGISIVVTIGGICTSLGLGAIQMTAGFQQIGWLDKGLSETETTDAQIVVIWLVTIMTTASVLMGLSLGIRYLSMFAFALGILLSLAVFMMDQTAYLMNLLVQSTGTYLQYAIFQLPFHTDAFAQLRPGEGRAIDGNSAATWWFDAWTIFYWNWWVSWAVFVGLFVTRISYGRTLREITFFSAAAPVLFLIVWFCIWGGAGLRQSRQALELEVLGSQYYNDTKYFQSANNNSFCYDVPQKDIVIGEGEEAETIFTNHLIGVTPVCKFESTSTASFNVLYSFSFPAEWDTGYGPYLSVVFIIALATYFATSSDSGSLVVDFLAANGRHNTHWIQRLFWALTEASVATALLSAGGSNALTALQAASIICGLPYTVILTYLLQSIYEMCEQAVDEDRVHFEPHRRQFIMPSYGGIFNVFEYMASFGRVHTARVVLGLDLPSNFQVTEFFTGLFLPFLPLQDIVFTMYPKETSKWTNILLIASYTMCFFFCAAAFPMSLFAWPSMAYWGWASYVGCTCILAKLKNNVRARRLLHGNAVGDCMSSFLLYPQVLTQMRIELMEYGSEQVKEEKPTYRSTKRTKSFDSSNRGDVLGESTRSTRSGISRRHRRNSSRRIGKDSDSHSVASSLTRNGSNPDLLDEESVASGPMRNPKDDLSCGSGHMRNPRDDLSASSGHMRNQRDDLSVSSGPMRNNSSMQNLRDIESGGSGAPRNVDNADPLGTSSKRSTSTRRREHDPLLNAFPKESATKPKKTRDPASEGFGLAEESPAKPQKTRDTALDGPRSEPFGGRASPAVDISNPFSLPPSRRGSAHTTINASRPQTPTRRTAADVKASFRQSQKQRKRPADPEQPTRQANDKPIPNIIEA